MQHPGASALPGKRRAQRSRRLPDGAVSLAEHSLQQVAPSAGRLNSCPFNCHSRFTTLAMPHALVRVCVDLSGSVQDAFIGIPMYQMLKMRLLCYMSRRPPSGSLNVRLCAEEPVKESNPLSQLLGGGKKAAKEAEKGGKQVCCCPAKCLSIAMA